MSKFIGIIVGAIEIVAGAFLLATPFAGLGALLITAGAGFFLKGVGTLIAGSGGTAAGSGGGATGGGSAAATRNPIAPWVIAYGRNFIGGTVVHINEFGDNHKYMDMVIVLASHVCQSVDALLFDTQIVQMAATNPSGWPFGGTSLDSFSPVQQTVSILHISRTNGVVTVILDHNTIPLLYVGDLVQIQNITGDLTLNGIVRVETIVGQPWSSIVPYLIGAIVQYSTDTYIALTNNLNSQPDINPSDWALTGQRFTYLRGGLDSIVDNEGQVVTKWPDYGRNIHMEIQLGDQTSTFPGMIYGTPNQGDPNDLITYANQGTTTNPWGDNHIIHGKTIVFLRFHYDQKAFAGGIPQIAFLLHGKNDIYDPRNSPPTYGYTENAALIIADYLSNTTWGLKSVYGTDIPYPQLIAAANVCDDAIPLNAGGTEPRYALNGKFDLSVNRGTILQNLLTSCAGRLSFQGGQWIIQPAAWYGSSPAPTPGYEGMSGGMHWSPTVSISDLYNGVKGSYISPSNNWQAGDIPPYAQDTTHGYTIGPTWSGGTAYVIADIVAYNNKDYIAIANGTGHQPDVSPTFWQLIYEDINLIADNGDRRWLDIQLPFTISAATAQRICKIELLRRRNWGTGTFRFNMAGYKMTALDVVSMTIPFFGWSGKLLEVLAHRFVLDRQIQEGVEVTVLGTEIDVQETDAAVYDWDPATEELTPSGYQQSAVPNPFTPAPPTGLLLESDESTVVITPSGLADSILVSWDIPVDGYVLNGGHIEVQYELILQYSTGTISVTNGIPNIVGTGTSWTADMVGETIVILGVSYGIRIVTDATHIILGVNYAGSTSGSVIYTILYSSAWIGLPSVNPIVTKVNINGVIDGAQYNVQIRSVNALGVPSDWVFAGPVTATGANAPLPWKPYGEHYSFAPSGYSFGMAQIQGVQGTQSIAISATPPLNHFSSIIVDAPVIDPFAVVAAHIGNLNQIGSWVAQVFPVDVNGQYGPGSNLTQFTVTAAAQRVSITVAMPTGSASYELFVGPDVDGLIGFGLTAGVPSTIDIDSIGFGVGYGPPDSKAVAYHATARRVIHAGIAAANVSSSGASTVLIGIPSAASSDAFKDRWLILISRVGLPATQVFALQPILHSNTATPDCTLTVPVGITFTAGDLIVISMKAAVPSAWSNVTAYAIGDYVTDAGVSYTALLAGTGHTPASSPTYWMVTMIADPGLISPFATGGLTPGAEIGNMLKVLHDPTGTFKFKGTFDEVKVIDNSSTGFNTFPTLDCGPGTVFIVVETTKRADVVTHESDNSIAPSLSVLAPVPLLSVPSANVEGYVALIEVVLQDANGNDSLDIGNAQRIMYIVPGPSATDGPAYVVPIVESTAIPDLLGGAQLNQHITLESSPGVGADILMTAPINVPAGSSVTWTTIVDNPDSANSPPVNAFSLLPDSSYSFNASLSVAPGTRTQINWITTQSGITSLNSIVQNQPITAI